MEEREENYPSAEEMPAEGEADHEEERDKLNADARAFEEQYPDVDLWKLEQDLQFRRFCGSRLYKESAAELYGAYLEFREEAEKNALAREGSRRSRSTGSGSGRGQSGLTPAQERELEEWNRNFPQMKMTAGEFKAR